MFLSVVILGMIVMYFYLWGDYMKVLIFLEFISLVFIMVILLGLKMDYFSLNFFFSCLIFLVCESSMGFLLFILYISMESEVVQKMNLTQF
uniref:NADH dehydrogenase subunit 4L n=1 Tax=Macrotrachela quadricornifera TaxID=104788 RepID=J7KI11_9BILA|nr:NADH dehydrogenase subunit 4L [Macrotrachela quadricornifera]AFQ97007.1 NADH dehydrogenase subunit 4L [Macrotrachela quadricornifera]AFQ97008.1 NADH dehydrogenase subunit 4L [Macrotrachela quadricornifera]AFQ97009.1 NADH dehydrogenase subunit 4L [Macrotrachela quadricornifera]AFQ97012.1 NADH dehydrogenase subunit 4L [Macrotrachela quadricornifera]